MSQEFLEVADAITSLLDRLEGFHISPVPVQLQAAGPLLFRHVSIETELHKKTLPQSTTSALRQAFTNATSRLELAFQTEWKAFLKNWRGGAPEDNFSSLAESFQQLHECQANKLKAEFISALERHSPALRYNASTKDTRFNTRVKRLLEDYFEFKPCPSTAEKKKLAEATGLELKQVSTWFANQRSRKGRVIRKLNKKEHTVSGGSGDGKKQQRTRPQPILEEPEPDLILGAERLDATSHEDGAGADVYGLEGVNCNSHGRISPVPSLSSSLGSSSNNDSSNSSLFQMPFDVPAPIVHVPQEDPALFQAPPLDFSQEQYKQSAPTTFVTPGDLPQLFPGIEAQPMSMPSAYFTAPQLAHSSSAESEIIPTFTLAQDPFMFSEPDLSSTMNMGEDYWDNILQTISEDGSNSPVDEQQQSNDLNASHQSLDLRAVDYAKQQPMLREQNQACDWSTWAMPVLEGFEAQLESQQPFI